jgi:hypothetical protein
LPASRRRASSAGFGAQALFDAFETKGAARLAAWLELTGEGRRMTLVRHVVDEVVQTRLARDTASIVRRSSISSC